MLIVRIAKYRYMPDVYIVGEEIGTRYLKYKLIPPSAIAGDTEAFKMIM